MFYCASVCEECNTDKDCFACLNCGSHFILCKACRSAAAPKPSKKVNSKRKRKRSKDARRGRGEAPRSRRLEGDEENPSKKSPYELMREAKIRRNEAKLAALGLSPAKTTMAREVAGTSASGASRIAKSKSKLQRKRSTEASLSRRAPSRHGRDSGEASESRRLEGEEQNPTESVKNKRWKTSQYVGVRHAVFSANPSHNVTRSP